MQPQIREISVKKIFLFVLALLPGFSFAQQFQLSKKTLVKLDINSAEAYQIDLAAVMKAAKPEHKNKIFIELNEKHEVLDLTVFDEKVFSESRLDWRQ